MKDSLTTFLADRTPTATESMVWGDRMRLHVAAYLSDQLPPFAFVTSVRAVVLHRGHVLVQEDQHNRHVLPGGQRDEGETPEATLRREVAEETGWAIDRVALLGFMHLHHLDSCPPNYSYPYPDFFWLIYTAEATSFSAEAKLADGYEVGTEILSVDAVRALSLTPCQWVYLEAAVRLYQTLTDDAGTILAPLDASDRALRDSSRLTASNTYGGKRKQGKDGRK
jgi:8-oxo-dGTP diphosphatase